MLNYIISHILYIEYRSAPVTTLFWAICCCWCWSCCCCCWCCCCWSRRNCCCCWWCCCCWYCLCRSCCCGVRFCMLGIGVVYRLCSGTFCVVAADPGAGCCVGAFPLRSRSKMLNWPEELPPGFLVSGPFSVCPALPVSISRSPPCSLSPFSPLSPFSTFCPCALSASFCLLSSAGLMKVFVTEPPAGFLPSSFSFSFLMLMIFGPCDCAQGRSWLQSGPRNSTGAWVLAATAVLCVPFSMYAVTSPSSVAQDAALSVGAGCALTSSRKRRKNSRYSSFFRARCSMVYSALAFTAYGKPSSSLLTSSEPMRFLSRVLAACANSASMASLGFTLMPPGCRISSTSFVSYSSVAMSCSSPQLYSVDCGPLLLSSACLSATSSPSKSRLRSALLAREPFLAYPGSGSLLLSSSEPSHPPRGFTAFFCGSSAPLSCFAGRLMVPAALFFLRNMAIIIVITSSINAR